MKQRVVLVLLGMLLAVSATGCKKQVPNDIIDKSLKGALRTHAPATTSAMCGAKVRGLANSTITVKSRGKENTGIAHVRGTPWAGPGTPAYCEGDLEFRYSYTSKTTGYKRKTTTTTWYLEHMKLIAVQTPGVTATGAEEDPDGDEDP